MGPKNGDLKQHHWDLPGGPEVKACASTAGSMGSVWGFGELRCHRLHENVSHSVMSNSL